MNRSILQLLRPDYDSLMRHLLPPGARNEEAEFLFAKSEVSDDGVTFRLVEAFPVPSTGFVHRSPKYLELTDETYAAIIKRAHVLGASILEFHSHPLFWPEFSDSDITGLRQVVPHVWWRLKGKPYGAVVVAPHGFDALLWLKDPNVPEPLTGIEVDGRLLTPTNRTILRAEEWK